MSRVPRRNRAGAMGFLMKDRCLFPECPLGINSYDLKDRIGEGFRKGLSSIRLDAVRAGRNPRRKWANLQSDCGPDIFSLKRCRVEHVDGMRVVLVNSGDYARDRREEMVELRKQRVPDVRNRPCVHLLVMTARAVAYIRDPPLRSSLGYDGFAVSWR